MIDNFQQFGTIVAETFQKMCGGPVFCVEPYDTTGDRDHLYHEYLGAFPDGTNPTFRKKSEHDCACCRHFIRRVGGVVTIDPRTLALATVWDGAASRAPEPYRTVARHLRDVVRASRIASIFRVADNEVSFGTEKTLELDPTTQQVTTWHHFHTGEILRALRSRVPDQQRGDYQTTVQVFRRGLVELTPDAISTVSSLIEATALYRGEEHAPAVQSFSKVQREFLELPGELREAFCWLHAAGPAARFRNTVIGTLVQDLSEGQDVERAVKSFEQKVAPQNYKRTTALITPGMVAKAMATIKELDLESALERRFAVIRDISVKDVKWVDGSAKPLMKGGIGDVLAQHVKVQGGADVVDEKDAEDIALDDFVEKILPATSSLEILFKGRHVGNLASLTAPCDPAPKRLFRWSNDFAWSYGGNVADSIAERVKKAGGKVEGAMLRISLSWFNYDDLDVHVFEPAGRGIVGAYQHIHFANRRGWTGGVLDVDMNAGVPRSREAVENVSWSSSPPDGPYRVVVNNYCHRETQDPGFVVEVESAGQLQHYSFNKAVRDKQYVEVVTLLMESGAIAGVRVGDPGVTSQNIQQERWGLKTEQFCKVSAVALSPNHWGGDAVGNRHTFFLLDGAINAEPTRGFYNEFLHPRLEPHRKVFEVIADKTMCRPSTEQLSGLGFSSTKKDQFIARVSMGRKRRTFNVLVGQASPVNR